LYKQLKSVYFALCQSIILYGILSWGGAAKCHMDTVKRAQKSVIRVLSHKPFTYPSITLFKECKLLDVRQLAIREFIQFIYKTNQINNNSSTSHNHTTRFAYNKKLTGPKMKTKFGQRHALFLSPFLYNKLENIKINKASLNTWLINLNIEQSELLLNIQK
jgi:hypothetical protein